MWPVGTVQRRMPASSCASFQAPSCLVFCGVDVGGTGCRAVGVRLDQLASPVTREGRGVQIAPDREMVEDLLDGGGKLATAATGAAGVDRIDAVAVGSASLMELLKDKEGLHRVLAGRLRTAITIVASDMLSSHIGALRTASGAVLAAGTGAVALGTDFDQTWQRVDGWGHLLGDAGGGAWIALRGLDAAMRAVDRRTGGSPVLLERLRARFGTHRDLVRDVYTRSDRAGVLASFVPDMAGLAADGDREATSTFVQSGIELAHTGAAALPDNLPPRLALVGGLFGTSPHLRTSLEEELRSLRPDVQVVDAAGSSVDGALRLALEAAGHEAVLLDHPPFVTSMTHGVR